MTRSLLLLVFLAGCTQFTLRANVMMDSYIQTARNTVDVLVIVDNSCSMGEEQGKLGSNFESFIQAFVDSEVDYQVATTTTDMMDPNFQGILHQGVLWDCGDPADPNSCTVRTDGQGLPMSTGTTIIDRTTSNAAEVFLGNTKVGITGSGFEMGLDAARWALCRALDPNDPEDAAILQEQCSELWERFQQGEPEAVLFTNQGFVRDEARLSLIFVSDEDDFSPDPVASYLTAYVGSKGDRAFRDHDLLNISAVVGDPPDGCPPGDTPIATPGFRYLDLALRTGGARDSICNEDFTPIVRDLGLVVSGLNNRFPLTRLPRLSTLEVSVVDLSDGTILDPATLPWVYDDADNAVVFDPEHVPPPDHQIFLQYQVAAGPSGVQS